MDSANLPPDEPGTILFVGQHSTQADNAVTPDQLSQAQSLGYDFLTTPITTSIFHARILDQLAAHKQNASDHPYPAGPLPLPAVSSLTPTDTALEPQNSNSALVGIVSPWIDLESTDPVIAHVSRQVLNIEIAYAAFCGISNIIVYGPTSGTHDLQFARDVREALGIGPYIQIHILLPMTGELELDHGSLAHLSEMAEARTSDDDVESTSDDAPFAVWDTWNTIRTVSNYSQKLTIALEIPRQLPSFRLQSRWLSESVRLLVFPRTSFLRNAKGYPVLSKPHQQLLSRFARLRFSPWIMLSDVGSGEISGSGTLNGGTPDPTPAEASKKSREKPRDPIPHLRYFRHLQQNQPELPPIERFGQGYQDYLQSPLQPLTDNLESITYEVFEKDPIKYEWYERAIAAALRDLHGCIDERPAELTVAIVGAGRGPLVTRALQASDQASIPIQCWAVEKNLNAFVLLQRKSQTDPTWKGRVNVVKSDMRHWKGPTVSNVTVKVDIIVSELLGSFADNELSPECLDGVQHVLHSEHGISIPQSYSAHLTPISTPRLHGDLLSRPGSVPWEIPYVVMLQQFDYLCMQAASGAQSTPDVREAWLFSHPLPSTILEHSRHRAGGHRDAGGICGGDGSNEHNARTCKLVFQAGEPGVCHGLGGYFETVLYEGSSSKVELSTNPVSMEEKSKDMISWFPIFFPLKAPVQIPKHSQIEVSMWRQTDDRSVWYEWMLEVFESIEGRKRRLAISELHSSRKNACLV